MTSDTVYEISPTFVWKPTHAEQLKHIAETDEYIYETSAAQSSSSPASQGLHDWPELKDAIKYSIRDYLKQELNSSELLFLHPAAALIPFLQEGDSIHNIPAASSQDGLATENGSSTAPGTSTDADPSQPPYIPPADTQNFFPSKRQPAATTIPPLTPTESAAQQRILFSMLDDFDLQPPFTIQRVAELVLLPHQYYRSPQKWISAMKRCLAVTATRDAFPISPVQGPVGGRAQSNGAHERLSQTSDMTELEMDRLDGLPPYASSMLDDNNPVASVPWSRSSSTSSTPDPLFSPIPFLIKQERAQQNLSTGDDGANGERLELTGNIPDLELGGADRTQVQMPGTDSTPRELVDYSASTAVPSRDMAAPVSTKMNPDSAEQDMELSTSDAATATVVDRVDEEMPPGRSESSLSTTGGQDLGVPEGQIDELDNPSKQITALSSTTTQVSEEAVSTSDTDISEQDGRHPKRRKSVASITD